MIMMLLLQTFFHKFFKADPDIYPEELQVLKRLVIVLTVSLPLTCHFFYYYVTLYLFLLKTRH